MIVAGVRWLIMQFYLCTSVQHDECPTSLDMFYRFMYSGMCVNFLFN